MSLARGPLLVSILALALALPLVGTPSTAAATPPRRGVVSDIREIANSDRFVIKGRLKQTYRRGTVIVEQRLNRGRWSVYSRSRSTATSRFRIPVESRGVTGDVVCYRLVVPGNRKYRRTVVQRASRGRYAGKRFCIETTFG